MFKKKPCALLLGISLLALGCAAGPETIMPRAEAKAAPKIFDFEAHRGGRDARPENTLYSYAYAMEMGATSIECDMQLTKDGHIVMSHNPFFNPDLTRDPQGYYVPPQKYDLRTMTLAEIEKFDVGVMDPNCGEYYQLHGRTQIAHSARVPRLEEMLQLVKDYGDKDLYLNIETKSYPDPASPAYKNNADPVKFVKEFNRIIKKYRLEDRVYLQSFDWNTLKIMKKLNPKITLSALWQEQPSWGRDSESLRRGEKEKSPWLGGLDIKDYHGDPVLAAHAIGADIVSPYYPEISRKDVELAHKLGMKVVVWTVNDTKDMENLLDMGVDGIITDRPWILRPLLEKRGLKVNPKVVNTKSKYHLKGDHKEAAAVAHKVGADAAI